MSQEQPHYLHEESLREILMRMPEEHRRQLAVVLGVLPAGVAASTATPAPSAPTGLGILPAEWQAFLLEYEIGRAGGHSVANFFRGGEGVPYADVVRSVARKFKVRVPAGTSVPEAEGLVIRAVWQRLLSTRTPMQLDDIAASLEEISAKHGKSYKSEGGALAALAGARLAGFSIYVMASTVLGGLTGALGVTLPLGVFVGISKAISIAIGPAGWAFLGLATTYKAGAPNLRKLLPVVLMVAMTRNQPTDPTMKSPR